MSPPSRTRASRPRSMLALAAAALAAGACQDASGGPLGPDGPGPGEEAGYCLDSGFEIYQGTRKDAIPSLTNPKFVGPGAPGTEILTDADPVVGIVLDGEALALPLYVMRWHEIVNLDRTGLRVAVTYCPLTGTAMAFDRAGVAGAELGVSGLLVENNLVMYDRTLEQSLLPQMLGSAICGPLKERPLARLPVIVTSFGGWRSLHPETRVLSTDTGHERDYIRNPYLDYDRLDAPPLYVTRLSQDDRRLPKELVLGIPSQAGPGLALPFLELAAHERAALQVAVDGEEVTVLWDRALEVAAAFRGTPVWAEGYTPPTADHPVFEPAEGGFEDSVTGSLWTVEGRAVAGPAEGSQLPVVDDALVAYWFAWAAFHEGTSILTGL